MHFNPQPGDKSPGYYQSSRWDDRDPNVIQDETLAGVNSFREQCRAPRQTL